MLFVASSFCGPFSRWSMQVEKVFQPRKKHGQRMTMDPHPAFWLVCCLVLALAQ
jgi:hypothetical protein